MSNDTTHETTREAGSVSSGETTPENASTAITPATGELATQEQSQNAAPAEGERLAASTTFRPRADVLESNEAYVVELDAPGSREDLIDVTVEDGVLSVRAEVPSRYAGVRREQALRAEFGIGRYERSFRLGEGLDLDGLSATYRHGVVSVRVPKSAQRRRRVEVTAG